ncbi:MAG TPA: GNAT family N-acetyltransferase [Pseudonocardiaceae bacterium]|nr:GNAT family N-acetyltransferase [Pseudonocardiaceae bacterium]
MKVVSHPTVAEFWQVAGALLTADPVINTVAVTVLGQLRRGQWFGDAEPILLTAHNTTDSDGDLVGAALCTPPFPLVVTTLPVRAMPAVVDHLMGVGVVPSGATGLRPQVEAFVAAWSARTGAEVATRMDQRLYRLGTLRPPANVPGEPSLITEDDVELVADWRGAFMAEAGLSHRGPQSRAELVRFTRDRLAEHGQFLWRVDGTPVAFAGASEPASGVSRIGPVYTLPELRGHGYGSAVTAAASRWALDQGAEHLLLYTDLANPVSNSIYQRIGYEPVADFLDVTFGPVRLR